ncbi:hypothetical protein RBB78_04240 [Tunturiibacter empetritectus]|uniref:hypothetical protein n=1 Tax=Tunturiibacter empetritectus TaxID=3069691 RepID=UPI003D9BBFF1
MKLETPKQAADAGGTIDQTTQKGGSYRYTARRIRTLSLAGHALEVRSEVSAPITITMLDTFPPPSPPASKPYPEEPPHPTDPSIFHGPPTQMPISPGIVCIDRKLPRQAKLRDQQRA